MKREAEVEAAKERVLGRVNAMIQMRPRFPLLTPSIFMFFSSFSSLFFILFTAEIDLNRSNISVIDKHKIYLNRVQDIYI